MLYYFYNLIIFTLLVDESSKLGDEIGCNNIHEHKVFVHHSILPVQYNGVLKPNDELFILVWYSCILFCFCMPLCCLHTLMYSLKCPKKVSEQQLLVTNVMKCSYWSYQWNPRMFRKQKHIASLCYIHNILICTTLNIDTITTACLTEPPTELIRLSPLDPLEEI